MYFEFSKHTHNQRRGACLSGMISLSQQIPLFSCPTGKPSRSISHGQAAVCSLELLLRGNASSHGNSCAGLINTWQKHQLICPADRLWYVSIEPSQTCNLRAFLWSHSGMCPQPVLYSHPMGIIKLHKPIMDSDFKSHQHRSPPIGYINSLYLWTLN